MPTERFFHLPDEKKQRIIDAAFAEFSRVPLEQVSINKIVQSAGIPRGSFYQYFADKLDLLGFVLTDVRQAIEQAALHTLRRTKGNWFAVCLTVLDTAIAIGMQEKNAALFQNIFPNLRLEDSKCLFPYLQVQNGTLHICPYSSTVASEFLTCLQTYQYASITKAEFPNVAEILVALLWFTIAQIFFHVEKAAQIRISFAQKLAIIKRGLQREVTHHV